MSDSARAETEIPLSPEALFDFLGDSGRLFRLNPCLEIEAWKPDTSGFRFMAMNDTNDRHIDAGVGVVLGTGMLTLNYDIGLKQSTVFTIEQAATGARLVVTDHYPHIEDPLDPRLIDVDRSLVPWVAAIRRHLINRRRWGWLPGWEWWNERFLLGMPPRQRRIVRLIVWISVLEFVVFLGAVAVLRVAS